MTQAATTLTRAGAHPARPRRQPSALPLTSRRAQPALPNAPAELTLPFHRLYGRFSSTGFICRLHRWIRWLRLAGRQINPFCWDSQSMTSALFINGVFEATLSEIEKTQQSVPGKRCYLQPYASERIKLLVNQSPSAEHPITLYLSLTDSLPYVSYRAKIVGWKDKRELAKDPTALAVLNQHIKEYQPTENSIYLTTDDGKLCVNLISVVDVLRLETNIPVSCFVKISDGTPLKKRNRSGGWSPVREQHEWLGTGTEAVKDDVDALLQSEVRKSLNDSSATRQERLAAAAKLPESIQVISHAFRRNPDVIAEVLLRASGTCEECLAPAPFIRTTNNTPYLEVHHPVMLSAGGEDTVANAVALSSHQ